MTLKRTTYKKSALLFYVNRKISSQSKHQYKYKQNELSSAGTYTQGPELETPRSPAEHPSP